jgi:hypothetical protein
MLASNFGLGEFGWEPATGVRVLTERWGRGVKIFLNYGSSILARFGCRQFGVQSCDVVQESVASFGGQCIRLL